MISQNLILCIDIGACSVKASQFFLSADGNLVLDKFAYNEFSVEGDEDDFDSMLDALSELIITNKFEAKNTYVSISGQNSFIRFVKVPSMTTDKNKIREIISFEATNTIPFPMKEVVWDSQLIDSAHDSETNEIDAMLVIVKNEDATRIIERIEALGNSVRVLEVAPTASYNAARANSVGNTQCEMILNIGGKCSSLIFLDEGRFFVRNIPIAGNTITQQIAKEFNIPFTEAEEMKRRHGFVALGGAYEEPDSEVAATVSKIVRNVMTRLHAEINRSINVYRASQHGRKPEKLFLSGGSSILAFTPRFFSEKLRIPVEYFNPFQIVTLGDDIDKDVLRDVAHLFSEMIGLALRSIGKPPIEISLVPDIVRKQHAFRMKRPYFYASAISLMVYLGITFWALSIQENAIDLKQKQFHETVETKKKTDNAVTQAYRVFQDEQSSFDKIVKMLEHRENWLLFMDQIQQKIPSNVWFTKISISETPLVKAAGDTVVKTETSEEDAEEDDYSGRGRIFGGWRRAGDEPAKEEKAKAEPEAKWLNLEGYIICRKGISDRLPETNEAIGLLNDHLKDSGLFGDIMSFKQDIYSFGGVNSVINVTRFLYTIDLLKPINSAEYTEELRGAFRHPGEKKHEEK